MNDLNDVTQFVHELPDFIKEKALAILLKNAELIQGLAQIRVRVDTGKLRDSIRVEQRGDSVLVIAGGPTAPYAPIVEAKYPFLEPSVNEVLPQIVEQLRDIQEEIDKHVNGNTV